MKKVVLKKALKPLMGMIGLAGCGLALAGGIEMPPPSGSGVYFSIFGGANWVETGQTSTVNFGGLATNQYVGNPNNSVVGSIVGGDLGYLWSFNQSFFFGVGVESSYTQVTSNYGIVNPLYLLGNFDTLSFNYEIYAVPLFGMLTLGGRWGIFEPYAIGGVGVSWNRAYNYNEVPTNPNLSPAPMRTMFQANTETEFAWTAGAGIAFMVAPSTSLGLEYRYTNYGDASFNGVPTGSQSLSLGDITSNALLARMTVVWAQ